MAVWRAMPLPLMLGRPVAGLPFAGLLAAGLLVARLAGPAFAVEAMPDGPGGRAWIEVEIDPPAYAAPAVARIEIGRIELEPVAGVAVALDLGRLDAAPMAAAVETAGVERAAVETAPAISIGPAAYLGVLPHLVVDPDGARAPRADRRAGPVREAPGRTTTEALRQLDTVEAAAMAAAGLTLAETIGTAPFHGPQLAFDDAEPVLRVPAETLAPFVTFSGVAGDSGAAEAFRAVLLAARFGFTAEERQPAGADRAPRKLHVTGYGADLPMRPAAPADPAIASPAIASPAIAGPALADRAVRPRSRPRRTRSAAAAGTGRSDRRSRCSAGSCS